MKASAKDLRFSAGKILDAVSRGEDVVITYRGQPCAKIVAYAAFRRKVREKHPLFGMWENDQRTSNVDGYVRQLRQGRFKC